MTLHHPILWVDQTLRAGLPPGRHASLYRQLIPLLKSLYAGLSDIPPTDGYFARLANHSGIRLPFRAMVTDPAGVQMAYDQGFQQIILSYRHTRRRAAPKTLAQTMSLARRLRLFPALHIVNASEWPLREILRLWREEPGFDAPVLAYGDEGSHLDPLTAKKTLTILRQALPCRLEFHAANGCGLATANAMAAIQSGVERIASSVGGLHHCPAQEEVLMIHKKLLQQPAPPMLHLTAACRQLLRLLEKMPPVNKAVIGENIFAHESGIHVDGLLKDTRLYEPFPPEEVGQQRRLVIGKHSGGASLQARFREWGVDLPDETARRLLSVVRRQSVANRGEVPDAQLWRLYQSCQTERRFLHDVRSSDDHRYHLT